MNFMNKSYVISVSSWLDTLKKIQKLTSNTQFIHVISEKKYKSAKLNMTLTFMYLKVADFNHACLIHNFVSSLIRSSFSLFCTTALGRVNYMNQHYLRGNPYTCMHLE